MRRIALAVIVLSLLLTALVVGAQDIEPATPPAEDADVAITFPPPVFVINGMVEIRGTADAIDLTGYVLEFRPLDLEATPEEAEDAPWFPATLPGNQAIRGGILGIWNTTTARDGLYELRLVVNVENGDPIIYRVSPIRVLNNPTEDFVGLPDVPTLAPTPTQLGEAPARPTLPPSPTPLGTSDPTVTAVVDGNVRSGDDVSYPRVGALLLGESARVIGISSFGSGWFYIELPNGRRGFIAPSVVRFSGSRDSLPAVDPPPPPTPPATATPITTANLQVTGIQLIPAQPVCAQSFDILINVQNTGTGPTNSSGSLRVLDRHIASGTTNATTVGGFPVLQPGESFVVATALTVDTYFDEEHLVEIELDINNEVLETNEGDNIGSITYTLQPGNCP